MNLVELIATVRTRVSDETEPYLWSDQEITLALNDAENEAAERALLIQDATTADVCQVDLVADTSVYALHTSVLEIVRASLSDGTVLKITSREKLDKTWNAWDTSSGPPKYVFENGDGNVTIVPNPSSNDTLSLIVKRLPIVPMADDTDTPEIHELHHYRMLDWAISRLYLKQDADAFDKDASLRYENAFTRSFGYRHDANVQRKQRDKRPNVVKSNW